MGYTTYFLIFTNPANFIMKKTFNTKDIILSMYQKTMIDTPGIEHYIHWEETEIQNNKFKKQSYQESLPFLKRTSTWLLAFYLVAHCISFHLPFGFLSPSQAYNIFANL